MTAMHHPTKAHGYVSRVLGRHSVAPTDGAPHRLAASKGKECDGRPNQHAGVQVDKPGKVRIGCQGGMIPKPCGLAELA